MDTIKIHDKIFEPYLNEREIAEIVRKTALEIYEEYKDETPVFIGVLNGVMMYLADLLRCYPGNCEVAFVQMKSYEGTETTGVVQQKMRLTKDIENRHIILVEDIVDTGNTVERLYAYFQETQKPKSIKISSFLLKPEVYKKDFPIHFVGKEIPNKFVLGYGLDYDELGRNLPALYQLAED